MEAGMSTASITPDELDDLDAAYAAIRRTPYRFRFADQAWELPHIGELDYRLQQEIENANGLDTAALEALFARCFGKEQAARWALIEVPLSALFMLFERWLRFCGVEMGEAPASNDSSASIGEKSRPTSDTTTSSGSRRRSSGKAPAKRAPRKPATVVELPESGSPPAKSST
jgi:hypothetical protein